MGAYLDKPVTEKQSIDGLIGSERFQYGVSEMQGWRTTMEDAHITKINLTDDDSSIGAVHLFAIFDGHGGREVALFCKKYLGPILLKQSSFYDKDFRKALTQTFYDIDDMLRDEKYSEELREFSIAKETPDQSHKTVDKPELYASDDDVNNEINCHTQADLVESDKNGDASVCLLDSDKSEKCLNNEASTDLDRDIITKDIVSVSTEESNTSFNPSSSSERDLLRSSIGNQIESAEAKGFLSKNDAVDIVLKMVRLKKLDDIDSGSCDQSDFSNNSVGSATDVGCTAIVALIQIGRAVV